MRIHDGFCLGCGRSGLRVEVPTEPYAPPHPAEVPTWCLADRCQQARAHFDEVCDRILNEED